MLVCFILVSAQHANAQVPSITYSGYTGPKTYTVGQAITTLTPSNSGGTIILAGPTTTFAGSGAAGFTNETGIYATFNQPLGTAMDASGNIYVSDAGSHIIRKITSQGVVTKLAGIPNVHGATNGSGDDEAAFYHPFGLAVDASGNVYVADENNNMIRMVAPDGTTSTLAGSTTAGSANGTGGSGGTARFHSPTGVALDGAGNLYVADSFNNLIRKIVLSTGAVTTFAGSGTAGSSNNTNPLLATFNQPYGVAFDASGNLYVADHGNNMIRKITSAGVVTTYAGTGTAGSANGAGLTAAQFNGPNALTVDALGNIYVADGNNNKIRMITTSQVVSTLSGTGTAGGANGLGSAATFNAPSGIASNNATGSLYVSDANSNMIRKVGSTYYTINPTLPAGLSFDKSTGYISGTPTILSGATNFTITAYSAAGSGSVTLNIAVLQPTVNLGYAGLVQTEIVKVPFITTDAQLYALSITQKQTTRNYLDGLGRTMQMVAVQASPAQNDLIQPIAYNNLGRQTTNYLPYAGQSSDVIGSFRPNAVSTDQASFYNITSQYIVATDPAAYAQKVFEASPLQRGLSSGMVGNGYQPASGPGVSGTQHYKTAVYRANVSTTDGNILVWNPYGTFTTGTYYADNTLAVTDAKDEDNTETLTFTDLTGHVILKRQISSPHNLDTYYIYDMAGIISYVIPPAATYILSANSYNLTIVPLSTMVFHFSYDGFGRMVSKTVPAKGTQYIIYDPLNRPVLSQDANMAAINQWNYIKYDSKNRPIISGTYTDNTSGRTGSSGGMQTYVNSLSSSYNTTWYESRTSTPTNNGYYTNTAVFPLTGTGITIAPQAYNYYDDYDMNYDAATHAPDFTYLDKSLGTYDETPTTASIKGMPTMTSITTVGAGLSNVWLTKVAFYDKRGNIIQIQSNNHLYYLGQTSITDYGTSAPDFMGVPQVTLVSKQSASSTTTSVQTTMTYDHMYRIKQVTQAYNGGASNPVAAYTYNELGQVVKKSLGYVNSTTWLQYVDIRFNIRGQLLSINNSKLSNDGGITNNDSQDVFGAVYLYDQWDSNLGNTKYYNGKLSAVKWMAKNASGTPGNERAFLYSYDAVNRYTGSTYAERLTAGTTAFTITHGWDETGITYDDNGNIKTIQRNTSTQPSGSFGTATQIDNLTYTYIPTNPNQLQSVSDASGSSQGFVGGGGSNTYNYDANGNLKSDPYKGLTFNNYNYLNRPDQITVATGQYINYTYDATGNLIRKQAYKTGSATIITDYIDGFVYNNQSGTEVLAYFPMPEGRVRNDAGTLNQEFVITDQQGNARISFQNSSGTAVVRQENSYYGYGMVMGGALVFPTGNVNNKLYNGGSEWQNDYTNLPDYYQTYYRNYDAALGRWVAVDPKAESAASMTSYQYAGNNPIMYNDPMGDLLPTPGSHTPPPVPMSPGGGAVNPFAESDADFQMLGDAAMLWMSVQPADEGGGGSSDGSDTGDDASANNTGTDTGNSSSSDNSSNSSTASTSSTPPSDVPDNNTSDGTSRVLLGGNPDPVEPMTYGPHVETSSDFWFWSDWNINQHLVPNSINFALQGPGNEHGEYYFANISRFTATFTDHINSPESGDYKAKQVVLDVKPFSIGIPEDMVGIGEFGRRGAQFEFADALDLTLKEMYTDFKNGYISQKDNVTQIFYDTLYRNLGGVEGGVYENDHLSNVPWSQPQFTTYPNH